MSIKNLIENIGKVNIAKDIDKETLVSIGQRVAKNYERDKKSMEDWSNSVKKGLDLMKQEWEGKSFPWENASNYKDPSLTQAAIKFGDRASLELLRTKNLVSSEIIGTETEEKKNSSKNVTTYHNYQINHDMNDWRGITKKCFYVLPNSGVVFKNTVYDPLEDICESHLIQYPNFAINQATKSMEECRSFSIVLDFTDNEIFEKVNSGRWLELETEDENKGNDKKGEAKGNEEEEVISSEENPCNFIEQQCYYDIDDDGYEEPYIITIYYPTRQVVRIVARYDENSVSVRVKESDDIISLSDAREQAKERITEQFGGEQMLEVIPIPLPEVDDDEFDLVKITPFQQITKYGFIPSSDGTFLDTGYSHLMGALVQQTNALTNQITDKGTINNLGGGFLSREFRKEKTINDFAVGEWKKTNVPASLFSQGILPIPQQEPSPTLYSLNEKLGMKIMEVMNTMDSNSLTSQTAPTTALAMIQEAMISTSALFQSILNSMSHEFQVLFRINQRVLDNDKYLAVVDNENADFQIDFQSSGFDIVPTANAEMSSKMQRTIVAELEMQQFDRVAQSGGNPIPIVKNYFESIGSNIVNEIFPDQSSMSPEDKKRLEQMTQAQETSNKINQMQLEILKREQDRLDRKTASEAQTALKELDKMNSEIAKNIATALKTGEEAETESLKNRIGEYTLYVSNLINSMGNTNDRPRETLPGIEQTARTNNQGAI